MKTDEQAQTLMLIIDLTQELKLQNKGSQSDKAWKGDVPKSHDIITSLHK